MSIFKIERLVDKNNYDDDLTCPICAEMVQKPQECSNCQTLYCTACIEVWAKKSKKCPTCA
jgi:E3 ubiquitin-protein ligase NRDP1